MIKKVFALIVVFSLCLFHIFSETVLASQLLVYDRESNVLQLKEKPMDIIYEKLSEYWLEGLITYKKVSERDVGEVYNTIDANRACSLENADYILFGYLKKNESYWSGNIKLYSFSEKKVIREFFASDDINHYERILENFSSKILEGLQAETGLRNAKYLEKDEKSREGRLPVSVYYWSPVDSEWSEKMLGLCGCEVGFELFPTQPKMTFGKILYDYSIRPYLSYSYGKEKDGSYPLNYHAITMGTFLFLHFHFDQKNAVYAGPGLYYEVELMSVVEKYEDEKLYFQNMFGSEFLVGYETSLSESLNFFTEIRGDFHLNDDRYFALKPVIGLSVKLFGGNE